MAVLTALPLNKRAGVKMMIAKDKVILALRGLTTLLLGADAVTLGFQPQSMAQEFAATGFAMWQAPVIAAILALALLLYAIPRTALIGAILLTGFLGGAICAHFRLGEIGSPAQLICAMLGAIVWGGVATRHSVRPWLDSAGDDHQG
ncbi:MAG: DoxX family protein [Candidatus Sphingomonas colombiensis]|nr:DoxX family protein [Sphingomonas sp.]WEK43426.1 MAG: DoxX family protein [Sphingomonas sp.]